MAGYIINPGGSSGLLQKVSYMTSQASSTVTNMAAQAGKAAGEKVIELLTRNPGRYNIDPKLGQSSNSNQYQTDKLYGKK